MNSRCRIGLIPLLLLFAAHVATAAEKELPEEFLGTWKVAESINFEDYLIAKGHNWIVRQLVLNSPVDKVFEKSTTPNAYNAFIIAPLKQTRWYNWELGKPFTGDYVDDDKHEITFDYNPKTNTMTETHKSLTKPDDPIEVCSYTISEDGRLVMAIQYGGVNAKRFYDKKTELK